MAIQSDQHCAGQRRSLACLTSPDLPSPDHMTKLRNVTNIEISELSAFPFSLQLMINQTINISIVFSDYFTKQLHK